MMYKCITASHFTLQIHRQALESKKWSTVECWLFLQITIFHFPAPLTGGSQSTVIPDPGNPRPSDDLHTQVAYTQRDICTYMQYS